MHDVVSFHMICQNPIFHQAFVGHVGVNNTIDFAEGRFQMIFRGIKIHMLMF